MRLIACAGLLALALAGCATTEGVGFSGPQWVVTQQRDAFNDSITKMVTFGDYSTSSGIITRNFRYYPFVGTYNGELFVGLRSGGKQPIPTGTVQIRVDDQPAWTITPSDTPLYLLPPVNQAAGASVPGVSPELNAQVKALTEQSMQQVARSMSPFTAVTGDKAKQLVGQMLAGKRIIFRVVGINQSASTAGQAEIDQSFINGVQSLGLNI